MRYKYLKFTCSGAEKKFNEDAVEVVETNDGLLAVLCDGVGGDKGGELASRIALKSAIHFFNSSDNNDYLERIRLTIEESNDFVINHSSNSLPVHNMATTFEILFLKDNFVYWGHIGDSRIYNLKSNRLNLITKDHSLVQKLLDEGYISQRQAENHPQKNVIIKALGDNLDIEADVSKIKLNDSDKNRFFICSDGVSNLINHKQLEGILKIPDFEEIKVQIIKLVKQLGAADDYSFIVIEKIK